MDALKALKAQRDALKQQLHEVAGDSKHVKKTALEEARIRKIQEEEAREREEKERKRKLAEDAQRGPASKAARVDGEAGNAAPSEPPVKVMPREEVIRRLRALGQPATLFGEEDYDRLKRLVRAEQELQVEDDAKGGHQANTLLELAKREKAAKGKGSGSGSSTAAAAAAAADGKPRKEKSPLPPDAAAATKQAAAAAGAAGVSGAAAGGAPGASGTAASGASALSNGGAGATTSTALAAAPAEDPTLAAFQRAAQQLAEKRAEETMAIEERIAKWIRRWSQDWEADLDARPEEVKASTSGRQTTMVFKQTMSFIEPLYDRLKARLLADELRTGLWMMVQAMRDRNYLYANDVYLKLAIGNAPWPIGVTSVGIHERSAREKISHVMNSSGQAHIMNDEATRKILQAIKRLITFVQRAYPTDPSRCADFSAVSDVGVGIAGAGSNRLALLEAEARGEDRQALGLPDAPHYLESDGSIKIPTKWEYILAREQEKVEAATAAAAAAAAANGGGRGSADGAASGDEGAKRKRSVTPPA